MAVPVAVAQATMGQPVPEIGMNVAKRQCMWRQSKAIRMASKNYWNKEWVRMWPILLVSITKLCRFACAEINKIIFFLINSSICTTGWTPLHEACNHGHYNVAMILVKAGANVNARGLDDDTPLHGTIVVKINYSKIKWKTKLLKFSAPFTDAAIVGQLKLVKMLVERGADPNFKNRKGKTPCDVASSAVYNFLITARGELYQKLSFIYVV